MGAILQFFSQFEKVLTTSKIGYFLYLIVVQDFPKRKMTTEIAKNIGTKKALQFATIGILIAFLFMMLLAGGNPQWMVKWNYWINIVIGIGIFYGLAYFFGKNAGYEILIKKKDSDKIGAKYGFLTLTITAFLVGWTGFVQEGMEPHDTFWDSFEDYIFKPFFWIMVIGFIPAILVGIQFGKWIKRSKNTEIDQRRNKKRV